MSTFLRLLALGGAALLAACGGGGSAELAPDAWRAQARQASPPGCAEHVYVTIVRIAVQPIGRDAGDLRAALELPVTPPRRIDLATLNTGVLRALGLPLLPTGRYRSVRLVLAPDDEQSGGILPQAVQMPGAGEVRLSTAGAAHSGIHVQLGFEVPTGRSADVSLLFDACSSVLAPGQSGRTMLRPTLTGTMQLAPIVAPRGERMVSTTPAVFSGLPALAALPSGGWVLVWYTFPASDVRMQQFDAVGEPVGEEITVNSWATPRSGPLRAAVLKDAGWVVAWVGTEYESLVARRFDAAGNPLGAEVRVNGAEPLASGSNFGLAPLQDGGWALAWVSADGKLNLRRYGADGGTAAPEMQVNSVGEVSRSGLLAALVDGGLVAAWITERPDGSGLADIRAQRFNAAGAAVGAAVQVNPTASRGLYAAAMAGLAGGGWVVTWQVQTEPSDVLGGRSFDVYARRFDAAGRPAGSETLVNTTTQDYQFHPDVAGLVDGGYVVVWQSYGSSAGFDIESQRFDPVDARLGGERLVNTTVEYNQWYAAAAGLTDGGWVIAWMTLPKPLWMQRYAADGTPL